MFNKVPKKNPLNKFLKKIKKNKMRSNNKSNINNTTITTNTNNNLIDDLNSINSKVTNESAENLRRITTQIQNVYENLNSVANEVIHIKTLYSKIIESNEKYSELIAMLVIELKNASKIKLKVFCFSNFSNFFYFYISGYSLIIINIASTRYYRKTK